MTKASAPRKLARYGIIRDAFQVQRKEMYDTLAA